MLCCSPTILPATQTTTNYGSDQEPADVYLIDLPSAYLEAKQCLAATARVIKWFIRHERKAAVVVEDNFLMASRLADRYIVLEGQPFVDCTANGPVSVLAGANLYSSQLDDDTDERDMVEFWLDLKKMVAEHTQQKAAAGSSY